MQKFIDDNIAEINRIKTVFPEVKTLLADKELTYKLNLYPLLERYTFSKDDNLRASDIEAKKSEEFHKALDKNE